MLGAPAILSRCSRLLIDPNRGLDDPTLIMQISDGLIVPGNVGLDRRGNRQPGSRAITALSSGDRAAPSRRRLALGKPPVIVSMHSFTQAWKGMPRPWSVGVLVGQGPAPCARPCLRRSGPFPISRSATTCPIPDSSRAIRSTVTARPRLGACLGRGPSGSDPRARGPSRMGDAARPRLRQGAERCRRRAACGRAAWLGHRPGAARKPRSGTNGKERRRWTRRPGSNSRRLPSGVSSRIFASAPTCRISTSWSSPAFCRNCLANWYQDAAAAKGISLSKDEAREIVYGMAYDDWKAKFQTEAPAKPRAHGLTIIARFG